ncbi:Callose synthase 3 [Nymphaea thermarum]|nr:Callose synthase 3 [Nymphaea thermarum]
MAFELYGMLAGNVSPMTGETIKPACGSEEEAFRKTVVTPIFAQGGLDDGGVASRSPPRSCCNSGIKGDKCVQNLWKQPIEINCHGSFSSQQMGQSESPSKPSTDKQATPIASRANFRGALSSRLGTSSRTNASNLLACSKILCLSATNS